MKNIVICCDGTNNKVEGDLTNVVRLFQVATNNDAQITFYHPGVGTMASPNENTWLGKRWSLLKGLAFGTGLNDHVMDAYRYLMTVYEPGDKIFLFGFSRGAFTVRVLAGMLHGVGLLRTGSDNMVPYLWDHYRGIHILRDDASPAEKAAAEKFSETTKVIRQTYTRPCPVEFLGVWDTVGSVGMYNMNQSFPFTFENRSIAIVRHAVSLDERRAGFRSNVFKADATPLANGSGRPRVMNVWFAGVHSDVGGGYLFRDSGLAMNAFEWMVREAKQAGLIVDGGKYDALMKQCQPDAMGKMHESLTGAWTLMEYLPARRYDWNLKKTIWRLQPNKPRTMVQSPFLHRSVIARYNANIGYVPKCLKSEDLTGALPVED